MKITLSYLLFIFVLGSGCTTVQQYCEQTGTVSSLEGTQTQTISETTDQKSPVGLSNYNAADFLSDEGFISKQASQKKMDSFESTSSTGVGDLFHGKNQAKLKAGISPEDQALAGLLLGTLSVASLALTLALLVMVGYLIVYPLALSVLFSAIGLVVSIKPFKNRNTGKLSKKGRLNAIWGFWLNAGLFGFYFLITAAIFILFFVFHFFMVYSDQPF